MKAQDFFYSYDDKMLLLALAKGQKEALEALYLRHGSKVLSFCQKRGLSRQQAEDICQIVFLQIYRKRELYNPQFEALAWLFVITKSEMRDYLKKQGHQFTPERLSETPAPEDLSYKLEVSSEVSELLQHLPEKEQQVIRMHYLDEMTYEEISKILQMKEPALRKIASRGLQFLSQLKGEHS